MARGPRKVRVFRNLSKSASWYVEWRDETGRRHCESCGQDEAEARRRALEIDRDLHALRAVAKGPFGSETPVIGASRPSGHGSLVSLNAVMKCAALRVPVELVIEITPELRRSLTDDSVG